MHNYPIANNRAMIDLRWCDVFPCDREELEMIMLVQLGFKSIRADAEHLARQIVNAVATYRLGASFADAPTIVDCSSFVQWVFAQLGIWLPRYSVDQRDQGLEVDLNQIQTGDLIFTTGCQNFFEKDATQGVGHVGILTEFGTVIEANAKRRRVIEVALEGYITDYRQFRGVRRILPPREDRLILDLADNHEISYAKDVLRSAQKCIPLQTPVSS